MIFFRMIYISYQDNKENYGLSAKKTGLVGVL
jgi:hypothetical protein